MNLFSFVECADQTQSLKALTFPEPLRLPGCPPPLVATKVPPEWCRRYLERKYYALDPVVRRTPMFAGPFLWDELAKGHRLQACEQRVLREAREAGLKNGVSVPLFSHQGEYL